MAITQQKSGQSIARRLFYSHLLIALLVATLVGAYFYRAAQLAVFTGARDTLSQIARSTADRLHSPDSTNAQDLPADQGALQLWLDAQRQRDSRIAGIQIYARQGDGSIVSVAYSGNGKAAHPVTTPGFFDAPSASSLSSGWFTPGTLYATSTFARNERTMVVVVDAVPDLVDQPLNELRRNAGLAFVLSVLLALIMSQWLARNARSLIGRLVEYCRQIADGHFEKRLELRGDDEFVRLGMAFDDMATRLKRSLQERDQMVAQLRGARDQLEQNVKDRTQELDRINNLLRIEAEQRSRVEAALAEAAGTDHLTKLLNRRGMLELVDHMVERLRRQARFFCLVVIDIDHFKRVNDQYGHDMGDKVLAAVASLLKSELKSDEAAARWGGEEFLLLWPDIGLTAAEHRTNRIRELLASKPLLPDGPSVSISAGISEYTGLESINQCLTKADKALYRAKEEGRNRVLVSL